LVFEKNLTDIANVYKGSKFLRNRRRRWKTLRWSESGFSTIGNKVFLPFVWFSLQYKEVSKRGSVYRWFLSSVFPVSGVVSKKWQQRAIFQFCFSILLWQIFRWL